MENDMDVRVLEQGTVYSNQESIFGYTAWPSNERSDDGDLLVTASGMRMQHLDPFGKVVLFRSHDEGRHWSAPMVIVDTSWDDRDAGIVNLGGGKYLVTTFDPPCPVGQWYRNPKHTDMKSIVSQMYADMIGDQKPYTGSFV